MAYELFPHQIKGAAFLTAEKGTKGLFFGMGTGKTVTSLEASRQLGAGKRILIIAPPIALPMWQNESTAYLIDSDPVCQILKSGATKIVPATNVIVVSYAIATKRAAELRDWLQGGILICDESHALKSVKAKRTKAILGRGGIASGSDYAWMLTGTPITRWNDDLYPFVARADIDGLKKVCGGTSNERFQLKFTVRQRKQFGRGPVHYVVVGNQNTEALGDWIYSKHALRVDLEEVFKSMPPLTKSRYVIDLDGSPEFNAMMRDVNKLSMSDIKAKLEAKEPALASIRRELGLAKVKAAAVEIAERVESGQRILVGAWHTDVIDALQDEMKRRKYTVATLDGRTSSTRKEAMTEAWNKGEIQVFVGQIAAMGVSLNLQQGGNQIIVVEPDWSPSIMAQFEARLWRFGQKKHVHVDYLTSNSKLDEALSNISQAKEREHAKFNEIGRKAG